MSSGLFLTLFFEKLLIALRQASATLPTSKEVDEHDAKLNVKKIDNAKRYNLNPNTDLKNKIILMSLHPIKTNKADLKLILQHHSSVIHREYSARH